MATHASLAASLHVTIPNHPHQHQYVNRTHRTASDSSNYQSSPTPTLSNSYHYPIPSSTPTYSDDLTDPAGSPLSASIDDSFHKRFHVQSPDAQAYADQPSSGKKATGSSRMYHSFNAYKGADDVYQPTPILPPRIGSTSSTRVYSMSSTSDYDERRVSFSSSTPSPPLDSSYRRPSFSGMDLSSSQVSAGEHEQTATVDMLAELLPCAYIGAENVTLQMMEKGGTPDGGKYRDWTHPNGDDIFLPSLYLAASHVTAAPAYVTYVKHRTATSHNQIREWLLRKCSWKLSEALACQLMNNSYKNSQPWQWIRLMLWAFTSDQLLVQLFCRHYQLSTNDTATVNAVADRLKVTDDQRNQYIAACITEQLPYTVSFLTIHPTHLSQYISYELPLTLRPVIDAAVKELMQIPTPQKPGTVARANKKGRQLTRTASTQSLMQRPGSGKSKTPSLSSSVTALPPPRLSLGKRSVSAATPNTAPVSPYEGTKRLYASPSPTAPTPLALGHSLVRASSAMSIDSACATPSPRHAAAIYADSMQASTRADSFSQPQHSPPTTARPLSASSTERPPLPVRLSIKPTINVNTTSSSSYTVMKTPTNAAIRAAADGQLDVQQQSNAHMAEVMQPQQRLANIPEVDYGSSRASYADQPLDKAEASPQFPYVELHQFTSNRPTMAQSLIELQPFATKSNESSDSAHARLHAPSYSRTASSTTATLVQPVPLPSSGSNSAFSSPHMVGVSYPSTVLASGASLLLPSPATSVSDTTNRRSSSSLLNGFALDDMSNSVSMRSIVAMSPIDLGAMAAAFTSPVMRKSMSMTASLNPHPTTYAGSLLMSPLMPLPYTPASGRYFTRSTDDADAEVLHINKQLNGDLQQV